MNERFEESEHYGWSAVELELAVLEVQDTKEPYCKKYQHHCGNSRKYLTVSLLSYLLFKKVPEIRFLITRRVSTSLPPGQPANRSVNRTCSRYPRVVRSVMVLDTPSPSTDSLWLRPAFPFRGSANEKLRKCIK